MAASELNPNPRGWTRGNLFVDLEQIALATRLSNGLVAFVLRQDPTCESRTIANMSDEVWKDFCAALLIYRSNR